jgi:alpha-D-ribose 1-methylphosphonate 5-triphosphate synthase subunit PhnG
MIFMPAANLSDDGNWPEDRDTAKALFMTEVARIVDEGDGMLTRLETGMLELRLVTGQIFHLGDHTVTRVA